MVSFWRRFTRATSGRAKGPGHASRPARPRLSFEELEDRLVPSTLIWGTTRRDLVVDPFRNQLDITTSDGRVMIFNLQSQQMMYAVPVAGAANGADITSDGNSLYVADPGNFGSQGVVRKLDLNTFQMAPLPYNRVSGEAGTWDVALASNGKGLVDTQSSGIAVPLRQINTGAGTVTTRSDFPGPGGRVARNTMVRRSADHSLLLFTQSSNGPIVTYSAATDTFTPGPGLAPSLANAPAAVNRNGTLLAVEVNGQLIVMDSHFNTRNVLQGLDGGVVFDPNRDVAYAVSSSAGQVVAFDTNTWVPLYQLPIGEAVTPGQAFGNGVMAVSGDSRWLFLSTPSGVREFALVNPNPATHFGLSGFNGVTTAGTPFSMTITALDANGQVANGYTGAVHFASSDAQAVLPADYTFTPADAGAHTFTFTLKTAGSQALSVVDTHNPNLALYANGITVNPGAVALIRVDATGPVPAWYVFWPTFTARDAYNNVVTNYAGTIHVTSSDPTASLPADYTFTASDRGLHSFPVTLGTAGNQTLAATDTSNSALHGSTTVQVANYIPGLRFTASASAGSVTAGAPFGVTVTAYDQFNQMATHYVGTITFSSSDHGGGVVLPADYTFTAADAGVHTFTGVTLVTAANPASVSFHDTNYVTGGSGTGGVSLAVTPAAASTFRVTGFPTPTTAGTAGTFTVTAKDAYGNVATGYAGTAHFTSGDAQAVLPADYTFSASDNGVHSFSATLRTAGVQSLTATDATAPAVTGSQTGITVTHAAAALFYFTAPPTAQVGVPINVTITVEDIFGNVINDYAGTVHFRSTDPSAALPADYTFTAGDQGQHTFQVTFWTPGTQTLEVTDGTLDSSTQVSL
jgi:hypothetical protein